MKQRSVMDHRFSEVPAAEIPRSSFDRSHGHKTTLNAGPLYPIYVDEALPGDTFNMRMTAFARLATPIFPIMDNMFMETFFFFVPNRLVWDNWEKFNGSQDNPADSTDFVIPQHINVEGVNPNSLHDHMGIPPGITNLPFNALHSRAYALIYNEWFRDENLQDSITVHTDDGPDGNNEVVIQSRGKRHDYFTSCFPFPQKGESVTVGLENPLPVNRTSNTPPKFRSPTNEEVELHGQTDGQAFFQPPFSTQGAMAWGVDGSIRLEADVTNAGIGINDLRQAFQIQKLLERDARGGTRYTEIIRAHFGVTSPDARLQRPEYLGGGSSPVQISPVAQTSGGIDAADNTPQGNLAAFGTVALHNHGFTKSFTEHGVIIGLVAVRADLTYQQGLNRMWQRQTRFDYYWPALSHIGEQAVLNSEIFAQGTASDDLVFGYQERYAEYRYKPSEITAIFRSDHAQSLDAWHLSQDFATLPVLNTDFIRDIPPVDRVIAVPSEPHFIFDAHFNLRCARPMPIFGVPGLIDHF